MKEYLKKFVDYLDSENGDEAFALVAILLVAAVAFTLGSTL